MFACIRFRREFLTGLLVFFLFFSFLFSNMLEVSVASSSDSNPEGTVFHQDLQKIDTSPATTPDTNDKQQLKTQDLNYPTIEGNYTEVVVGLNTITSQGYSKLTSTVANHQGKIVDTVKNAGEIVALLVKLSREELTTFLIDAKATGQTVYLEPNGIFHGDSAPNDANWTVQWGPQKIRADYAWNTTAGNRTSILVAVIDTGIDYTHPDLVTNFVPLGYDFVNNDSDPKDDIGHGTHCAGVIAAQVNNTLGIAGIAQVRIMAEKGLNSANSGSSVNLANCIYHAVDQGAKILSNSWGGGDSSLIHDAVVYAVNHNVLVLASSGNTGTNSPMYPGAYNEVVCVAASDSNDNIASFSTWGSWVDVAAPGVNIFSTMPTYHVTLNETPYNFPMNYSYMNGTSMACPHAAGVAALIWSQFPNLASNGVRNQLIATADDRGIAGIDPYFGSGRINAQKGVEQSPPAPISVSVGVSPNLITIGSGTNISGSVASSGLSDKSGTVYFELSPNNLNWVSVGSTQSDSSGKYSYWCVPPLSGALLVRSYWIGNNNYEAATTTSPTLTVNSGDIYEPDNSFATAHLISVLPTLSSETHDIEPTGDNDYYPFLC